MNDVIDQIIDDNQEVIKLQEEKASLLSKECESCGQDLTEWKDAHDPGEHEYITMMSIADNYNGGVGGLSYTCNKCLDHMSKYHKPGDPCLFPGECELIKYQKTSRSSLLLQKGRYLYHHNDT